MEILRNEYLDHMTWLGITRPLDYPVVDMDSWLLIKPKYEYSPQRFSKGWREAAASAGKEEALIIAHIPGGFDEPRQLMGEEALCLAYYEDPELIHDILDSARRHRIRARSSYPKRNTVGELSLLCFHRPGDSRARPKTQARLGSHGILKI